MYECLYCKSEHLTLTYWSGTAIYNMLLQTLNVTIVYILSLVSLRMYIKQLAIYSYFGTLAIGDFNILSVYIMHIRILVSKNKQLSYTVCIQNYSYVITENAVSV